MGRKVGVGSSAEDITRFHLGPCPRGHLTPSTKSPARASFQAINVLGARPSGCAPHPRFLPRSTVRVPSFTVSGRPRLVEGGCPRNLGSVPHSPT